MVIKLVKVDSTDATKITLSIGTHLFGRGKLLNVEDKRVSRKHGELQVKEDKLIVKALHQNPCFYKKDKSDVQVLKCDCEIELFHGDRFGLLPDSLWFEVISFPTNEEAAIENEAISEQENTEKYDETANGTVCNEQPESPDIDLQQVNFVNETTDDTEQTKSNEDSNTTEDINNKNNDTSADTNSKEKDISEEDTNTKEKDTSAEDMNKENDTSVEDPQVTEQMQDAPAVETGRETSETDTEEPKSPQKRSHSPEEDNAKRVKLEPSDVKQEPDVTPGTSDSGNASASNNALPPSPQKLQNNLRERCYYGARCYRRNPLHMAQFSHPKDPDWGTGDKGVCPYGASCCKPDQKHWDTHNHPPGVCRPVNQGVCIQRNGKNIYIRANTVNIYDDHIEAEDSDGDSVDIDYEY
ncbi:aprataxin and PNK-like factor isoform X2 [Colias croceus]|uniref:aprataxin and PNK-like factor isoform X2 n=1 Tax=Colias crocea TaxID=72248 RepID=UPI001E27E1F2|nr:aprataxin and PNK-like factor isoform X2 [Colias croceus]